MIIQCRHYNRTFDYKMKRCRWIRCCLQRCRWYW